MSDLAVSIIRTVVPTLVGSLLAWLVAAGVDLDPATTEVDANPATSAALSAGLIALCVGIYYAAARILEQRWPQLGWLLGAAKQPTYYADDTPEPELELEVVDESGPPSDAPTEWLAAAGTAPGDVLPEAPIINDGTGS